MLWDGSMFSMRMDVEFQSRLRSYCWELHKNRVCILNSLLHPCSMPQTAGRRTLYVISKHQTHTNRCPSHHPLSCLQAAPTCTWTPQLATLRQLRYKLANN